MSGCQWRVPMRRDKLIHKAARLTRHRDTRRALFKHPKANTLQESRRQESVSGGQGGGGWGASGQGGKGRRTLVFLSTFQLLKDNSNESL